MSIKSRNSVKMFSAVIGGTAAVAMGVLSVAVGQGQAAAPVSVARSGMTVGETSTETTPPAAPAVSMAVPTIKGPAPLPAEQQAAE